MPSIFRFKALELPGGQDRTGDEKGRAVMILYCKNGVFWAFGLEKAGWERESGGPGGRRHTTGHDGMRWNGEGKRKGISRNRCPWD